MLSRFSGLERFFLIVLAGALLGLTLCTVARAAGTTANLTWTNPATYVDGSPLPATDIAGYTITWSGPPSGSLTLTAGSVTTATVPIACGSVNFTVVVNTTATALYPSTSSSPSSPPAAYATGVKCSPNPVTGVTAK